MAEILVRYQLPIRDPEGLQYEARAYGAAIDHVLWEGWLEFVPIGGGPILRTPRETTQPNRVDTAYWATGLTCVYLEGALIRAIISTLSAGLRYRERRLPVADDPAKRALHEMNVVQPIADGFVASGRRVGFDRAPVFSVGPDLVFVKIANQRVHAGCIICNLSDATSRKSRKS